MASRGKSKVVRSLGVAVLGALAAATFASAPGCADDNTMIFIRRILVPTKGCAFDGSPDGNATGLSWGILDVACRREYTANLLIANGLQKNTTTEARRSEANRVQVSGVEVRVVVAGGPALAPYTLPVSAVIDPGDATSPGLAVVGLPLVPFGSLDFNKIPCLGTCTTTGIKQVNFELRVQGTTLGGTAITSPVYVFPMRLGQGILLASADGGSSSTCIGQDSYYSDPNQCPHPAQ